MQTHSISFTKGTNQNGTHLGHQHDGAGGDSGAGGSNSGSSSQPSSSHQLRSAGDSTPVLNVRQPPPAISVVTFRWDNQTDSRRGAPDRLD